MLAAEMFDQGKTRAEVAGQLGVSWQSTHGWYQRWQSGGAAAMEPEGRPGPASKFSDEEAALIIGELAKGSVAHGYQNEIWTLRRVGALIRTETGKKASPSEVWRLLRRMRWSPQKPQRRARERDEAKIDKWKQEDWPRLCQKAEQENRTMVFVDECGFSQKSTAKNTWSPEGQTPILEMNFNWEKLSVIGGISLKSLYFQVHEESIKSAQVIGFLEHLQRHVRGKLLVIWDGLPAHRSKAVAALAVRNQRGGVGGATARLCAGAQSHRVPLGQREGERSGELLAEGPLGTVLRGEKSALEAPPPPETDPRLLDSDRT